MVMKAEKVCLIFVLSLTGCAKWQSSNIDKEEKIFPRELAGTWVEKETKYGWEIVITESGQVSELTHPMGQVKVFPHKMNKYHLIEQGTGLIEAGGFFVQFDPNSRELTVEVDIERFEWVKGSDVVEGRRKDILIGLVSDDYSNWDVDWLDQEYYRVTTSEVHGKVLTQDEDLKAHDVIIFVKKR